MTVILLLLLVTAPTAACAALLPGLDPAGRAVVSATGGLVIVALVAEVMLVTSLWSPGGGLAAVTVISAALLGVSRIRH
ncbi:hypothetical protein [Actinomadura sp. HBU206391]|uniref:hypothetical protein n=1 Tax=Actinomadura sp. HBU206391 TaxID=2731692 RepID=UPI00164FA20F|nr:hypothetical protein [Actinomadura sp. HBU206391]MBC6459317.1 hypothetical protein [Actinomadura sp. HBU206391]